MPLIFHDGENLYGQTNGNFVYEKKSRLDLGLDVAPAAAEARAAMFQAASTLSFETPADCTRLLAWSVLAPFCGALPWRPAGFVTGGSGTGKSTILQMIVKPLACPLYVSGSSTEAGIRQTIGNDCMGVEIDELESLDEREIHRVKGIFDLVRQSTSDDSPPIVKGTTSGKAMSFATHCMYLFSAISPGLERQADVNRFFIVDLATPTNDWPKVRKAVECAFTPENCAAVRAYTWPRIEAILALAESMVDAIREASGFDTRYAKLEGILFAAHWIVWKDRTPEDAELREWLSKVYATKRPETLEDDASLLLERMLGKVVQLSDAPFQKYTVQQMALALATGLEYQKADGALIGQPLSPDLAERFRKTLNLYGLYVMPRSGDFSVAVRNDELAQMLSITSQYAKVLARHPLCTDKSRVVAPTGDTPRRALVFSKSVLEGEPPI
jgi:putative DNA primase/helicase